MITLTYSSHNSYIILSNSALLLGIYFVNHYAEAWHLRLLQYVLSLRLVVFFEYGLSLLGLINIWYASRGIKNPFLSPFILPIQQYCFGPGPLLVGLCKFIHGIQEAFKSSKNKAPIVPVEQQLNDTSAKAAEDKLINLFAQRDPPAQFRKDLFKDIISTTSITPFTVKAPTSIATTATTTTTTTAAVPAATTTSTTAPTNTTPINSLFAVVGEPVKTTESVLNLPVESSYTALDKPVDEAQENTLKLEYTPCIRPPLKPSQHRERLLWFLSPTPEVVEDFRIEQMIQMEQTWHKFNDRNSRTLHDKMTHILLTKMLKPLAESIEEHEKILASIGRNLANCPSSVAMLSMILSANTTLAFNMPEIDSFINVGGSSRVEMRQYVIDRIKELASSPRMAAYRYVSQIKDMPTDAEIIMHIFNQYLSLKEPYAIPPLVPVEGDLFKFLLIYVKITPELDHWRL
ncbi:hypothetical protein A0J61_02678 [Choanephora cucurbitarum]|uniref:Uncharacterized protein n=1 Tax=Choanephora cucurbitarum TaxID=101091 RepID=A0A1C7NJC4_9FUNG|nr:hypothetical protein A0J61_02678 [Choanephora cucurbitarum]